MNHSNITFSDIFRSSFLSRAVESFSVVDALATVMVATVIGLMIYFVYRKTYSGVMYSRSFSISLVALSIITSLVILTVTSNVILSLGMVGALSIVRFRTAIKDPMDIVYLFWAIAVGIIVGAGMFLIALCGSLALGVIIYIMTNMRERSQPFLIIVNLENSNVDTEILEFVKKYCQKHSVKTKSIRADGVCELTIEVRIKDNDTKLINEISAIEGVENVVLLAYNGDFAV